MRAVAADGDPKLFGAVTRLLQGHVADGTKPVPTEGKDFTDTGVQLVTDKPAEGIESIDSSRGAELCWG